MPAITFGGAASGIDTQSIVDTIIAARSRPIVVLQDRVSTAEERKTAVGDLRARLSNLLARAQSLTSVSGLNARTATAGTTSGGTKVVSVAADSTAAIGTFQVSVEQLATATRVTSATAIGEGVTQGVALASAGFGTAVTTGTFSINGVTITIDENTVLSDGVDDGASNSILGKINNAGAGVTASVVVDGAGRANRLQLTSGATIQLGSGADTSNFLTAARLLASPPGTTRTSTAGMAGTLATANLEDARLSTAFSQATGSFTVNGATITYDAANESLNGILTKINRSSAGVTAAYDAVTDTVQWTSTSTGSVAIALADVAGNFLDAVGLLGTSQTLGQSAAYKIDGGATQYATTNTISSAVPGVTMTLVAASPGDNVTVTVGANDNAIVNAVRDFVEQYNSTMTLVKSLTAVVPGGESGTLASDSTVRGLGSSLRSLVTGLGNNLTGAYTNLGQLGVSFGAVGAAIGTTDTLVLDESKLSSAITADRSAVIGVLAALTVDATFQAGTGSLANATGTPTNLKAGTYTITDDGAGNLTVGFDPADGGATTTMTGTITAGGTNKTLIPGMTLTALGVLQAGSDTIVVTRDQSGVGVKLEEYLDAQLATDGTLDAKTASLEAQIQSFQDQIERMEARLTAEQASLEARFAQMEKIFARFQSQQLTLQALSTQLTSLRPQSSG